MYHNRVVLLFCLLVTFVVIPVQCDNGGSGYQVNYDTNYEYEKNSQNTFDYIVVGVGQSGSAVAARYSQLCV